MLSPVASRNSHRVAVLPNRLRAGTSPLKLRLPRTMASEAAGSRPRDAEDVVHPVLAVAVGADHVLPREVLRDEGEAGLQGVSLAPVAGVADDGAPQPGGVVEDGLVRRPAAVVDDDHDGGPGGPRPAGRAMRRTSCSSGS